jgi:hypothetical protein
MTLTRRFKETVQTRVARDSRFRDALLREAIDSLLAGDVETGNAILRDYINATVGFGRLGVATGTSPKSLMRMFGPQGNARTKNLFAVLACLSKQARVKLQVKTASR